MKQYLYIFFLISNSIFGQLSQKLENTLLIKDPISIRKQIENNILPNLTNKDINSSYEILEEYTIKLYKSGFVEQAIFFQKNIIKRIESKDFYSPIDIYEREVGLIIDLLKLNLEFSESLIYYDKLINYRNSIDNRIHELINAKNNIDKAEVLFKLDNWYEAELAVKNGIYLLEKNLFQDELKDNIDLAKAYIIWGQISMKYGNAVETLSAARVIQISLNIINNLNKNNFRNEIEIKALSSFAAVKKEYEDSLYVDDIGRYFFSNLKTGVYTDIDSESLFILADFFSNNKNKQIANILYAQIENLVNNSYSSKQNYLKLFARYSNEKLPIDERKIARNQLISIFEKAHLSNIEYFELKQNQLDDLYLESKQKAILEFEKYNNSLIEYLNKVYPKLTLQVSKTFWNNFDKYWNFGFKYLVDTELANNPSFVSQMFSLHNLKKGSLEKKYHYINTLRYNKSTSLDLIKDISVWDSLRLNHYEKLIHPGLYNFTSLFEDRDLDLETIEQKIFNQVFKSDFFSKKDFFSNPQTKPNEVLLQFVSNEKDDNMGVFIISNETKKYIVLEKQCFSFDSKEAGNLFLLRGGGQVPKISSKSSFNSCFNVILDKLLNKNQVNIILDDGFWGFPFELIFPPNSFSFNYFLNLDSFNSRNENLYNKDNKFLGFGGINYGSKSGWNYISNTLTEVNLVSKFFPKSQILQGSDASESNLKRINFNNFDILHFATHGFYLEKNYSDESLKLFENRFNPLMRSGLVLANANNKMDDENRANLSEDDGILTAFEVSYLNLSKTKLVVLSACKSGLGETYKSLGNFGLLWSLKTSGVKQILASLWAVDDAATSEYMAIFYKNWSTGIDTREAYNLAQKEIRKRYPKEFQKWAAFILVE